MFNIFKKKCPTCGMSANDKSISKHGEKFCSKSCVIKYEKKNNITNNSKDDKKGGSCCS